MGLSFDVTRRALTLGSADSTTGWYAKTFSTSTIEMVIVPRSMQRLAFSAGVYPKYEVSAFHLDPVSEGDEIVDSASNYYEVETTEPHYLGDSLYYYETQLTKIPMHYDRPGSSGTWHLDSDSLITDVRYRQKEYIQDHITPAHITKDDGSTLATYIICFGKADYPISHIFVTKGVDLIFNIDIGESEALIQADKTAYAYHERVPITLYAINKTTITATNLIEKGYQELRLIAMTYPEGSVRRVGRARETSTSLGSPILFSQEVVLEYTRSAT
jgi:hypothetical protein